MANRGSFIATNQFLSVDDYLVSDNGLFFAVMQSDGNFCVYRGSGPTDNRGVLWGARAESLPAGQFFALMQADGNFCVYRGSGPTDNRGVLWGARAESLPAGQFFALMQGDGNFCVYKGTPADNAGCVWATMALDPVVGVEISSIDYDIAAAKIVREAPDEIYSQRVRNDTDQPQTSMITGSASVAEMSGWSDSLAVKVGVATTFQTQIPFVVDGKVTASVDVTNTFTWNGSTTKTKEWGFNTPVAVQPHTTVVASIAVTLSTIAVPYTLTGIFTLRSGARLRGSVKGMYSGSNSHSLNVMFAGLDAVTSQIQTTTQALKETLTTRSDVRAKLQPV